MSNRLKDLDSVKRPQRTPRDPGQQWARSPNDNLTLKSLSLDDSLNEQSEKTSRNLAMRSVNEALRQPYRANAGREENAAVNRITYRQPLEEVRAQALLSSDKVAVALKPAELPQEEVEMIQRITQSQVLKKGHWGQRTQDLHEEEDQMMEELPYDEAVRRSLGSPAFTSLGIRLPHATEESQPITFQHETPWKDYQQPSESSTMSQHRARKKPQTKSQDTSQNTSSKEFEQTARQMPQSAPNGRSRRTPQRPPRKEAQHKARKTPRMNPQKTRKTPEKRSRQRGRDTTQRDPQRKIQEESEKTIPKQQKSSPCLVSDCRHLGVGFNTQSELLQHMVDAHKMHNLRAFLQASSDA